MIPSIDKDLNKNIIKDGHIMYWHLVFDLNYRLHAQRATVFASAPFASVTGTWMVTYENNTNDVEIYVFFQDGFVRHWPSMLASKMEVFDDERFWVEAKLDKQVRVFRFMNMVWFF